MTDSTQNGPSILNSAEVKSIENMIDTRFARWRNGRVFHLTLAGDAEVLDVTLTLSNDAQTFFYPVQTRILHRIQNVSQKDCLTFLLEYLESYFEDFFLNDEGVYLPIDWTDSEFDGIDFQIRGQIQNLLMESLADRLIAGETLAEIGPIGSRLHS
jgi:hypothetical protein